MYMFGKWPLECIFLFLFLFIIKIKNTIDKKSILKNNSMVFSKIRKDVLFLGMGLKILDIT